MKRRALPILVSCGLLTLAACSSSHGTSTGSAVSASDYVNGATLTMALSGDPGALNPATAVQGSTNLLLSFAYDPLVHVTPGNQIVSGLASSWTVTPTSVTFTIHKGATCSDGSAVTPDVVAKSMNWYVAPATKSPLVGVLVPADLKATANDAADTVTLSTGKPFQFLLQSMVAVDIVCGKGLANPSLLASATSGSGPYVLTSSTSGYQYTLTARKGYDWGASGTSTAAPGVPSTIVLKVVTDESTAANLLLTGSINSATFTGADRKRLLSTPGVLTSTLPDGMGEYFYNENPGHAGADPVVRKALTQAISLSQLAQIVTQGTGAPATGLTTLSPRPCQVNSVAGHLPGYDVSAAKSELTADGWVPGAGGIRVKNGTKLSLNIVYDTSYGPGTAAGAQFMAAAWQAIGVQTKISAESDAAWGNALFSTGNWDVSEVPIGISLPSQLIAYVSGPVAPKGSNFAGIRNATYDKLEARASAMSVASGACSVWAQAESALIDNFDVVPFAQLTQLVASKNAEVVEPGGLALPTLFRMLKG
jgi:peptide/nickel transport system substrate-binding protein